MFMDENIRLRFLHLAQSHFEPPSYFVICSNWTWASRNLTSKWIIWAAMGRLKQVHQADQPSVYKIRNQRSTKQTINLTIKLDPVGQIMAILLSGEQVHQDRPVGKIRDQFSYQAWPWGTNDGHPCCQEKRAKSNIFVFLPQIDLLDRKISAFRLAAT